MAVKIILKYPSTILQAKLESSNIAFLLVHVKIKLSTESCFTFRAKIRFDLQMHFLDVFAQATAHTELLAASRVRAFPHLTSQVQAHMVEKL